MGSDSETPFFFERDDAHLFGVFHEAIGPKKRLPFVFCHPFAEEKLWSHRVYVTFARELARHGYAALRFDCTGNGDSSGAFADFTLSTGMRDIESAVDVLKRRTGAAKVGLLGLRIGASLAFRVAAARSDVAALVLWSPILEGSQYLQELLRINLATQMAVYQEIRADRDELQRLLAAGSCVNVDGYEISPLLAAELSALSLQAEPVFPSVPTLIAHVERRANGTRPQPALDSLRGRFAFAQVEQVQEEPFWKEIQSFYDTAPSLFDVTRTWLDRL
jgi:exosortase A-associated hydrolase 2